MQVIYEAKVKDFRYSTYKGFPSNLLYLQEWWFGQRPRRNSLSAELKLIPIETNWSYYPSDSIEITANDLITDQILHTPGLREAVFNKTFGWGGDGQPLNSEEKRVLVVQIERNSLKEIAWQKV